MDDKRTGSDRRSGFDRRMGDASAYHGPERRSIRYRRSGMHRRKKN